MNSSRRTSVTNISNEMETVTTFLKENFDLVNLLLGILGVFIAFIALVYELKKKSKNKKS